MRRRVAGPPGAVPALVECSRLTVSSGRAPSPCEMSAGLRDVWTTLTCLPPTAADPDTSGEKPS